MAHTVVVTLKCEERQAARFRTLLAEIVRETRRAPGVIAFDAHESVEDATSFVLFERFADEQAYERHLATPLSERVKAELAPLVAERTMHVVRPLAV